MQTIDITITTKYTTTTVVSNTVEILLPDWSVNKVHNKHKHHIKSNIHQNYRAVDGCSMIVVVYVFQLQCINAAEDISVIT